MVLKILAVLRVLGRGRIVLKCFFTIFKKHYSALRILWVLQIIVYRVQMLFVIDMQYTKMVPKNIMIHIVRQRISSSNTSKKVGNDEVE
jgi:hypothetical protein